MPISQELLDRIARNEYREKEVVGKPKYEDFPDCDELPYEAFWGDEDIVKLCAALQTNTHVEKIVIEEATYAGLVAGAGKIGDLSLTALSAVKTLKELHISISQATTEGLKVLLHSTIKKLTLDGLHYNENVTQISFLAQSPSLEELSLANIGHIQKADLITFFERNKDRALPIKTDFAWAAAPESEPEAEKVSSRPRLRM